MSVKNVKHGFCIFEAKPNAAGATTKGKPAGMMGVTIVFLGPRTKKQIYYTLYCCLPTSLVNAEYV
jgi:hypothetical protein